MPHAITHMYVVANALRTVGNGSTGDNKNLEAWRTIINSNTILHDYARRNRRSNYRSDNNCRPAGMLYLGSFGPDFFYIPRPTGDANENQRNITSSIADIGHYNKTGPLVVWALMNLKSSTRKITELNPEQTIELAYWLGYMSHIATDSVIHPFINSIVGAYPRLRELFIPSGITGDTIANKIGQQIRR